MLAEQPQLDSIKVQYSPLICGIVASSTVVKMLDFHMGGSGSNPGSNIYSLSISDKTNKNMFKLTT